MTKLTEEQLAALAALDTPTVCNALEIVAPERRGYGYTTKPMVCARPSLAPIVGYARTARIRAKTPPQRDATVMKQQRLDYYQYIDEGPKPSITVIEDLDEPAGFGAFWGEVQSNIHKGLGCLGVVTSGSVRDIPDCAEGFQMIAGSFGPSHAWVHLDRFRHRSLSPRHGCGADGYRARGSARRCGDPARRGERRARGGRDDRAEGSRDDWRGSRTRLQLRAS